MISGKNCPEFLQIFPEFPEDTIHYVWKKYSSLSGRNPSEYLREIFLKLLQKIIRVFCRKFEKQKYRIYGRISSKCLREILKKIWKKFSRIIDKNSAALVSEILQNVWDSPEFLRVIFQKFWETCPDCLGDILQHFSDKFSKVYGRNYPEFMEEYSISERNFLKFPGEVLQNFGKMAKAGNCFPKSWW